MAAEYSTVVRFVEDLLYQRDRARKAKDFPIADALRQELQDLGLTIEDIKWGNTITRKGSKIVARIYV